MRAVCHLFAVPALAVLLLTACEEEAIRPLAAPELQVTSPLHFGDVPVGSSETGRLVVSNGGDAQLTIEELYVEPLDGVFQVGIKSDRITINGRRSVELVIIFTPTSEGVHRAELVFSSNHQGEALVPVVLLGNGISDVACLPCSPPPDPRCHETGDASISYVANASNSCESEDGSCAYSVVETPCRDGPCNPDTGLCPEAEPPAPDPICGDGEATGGEECDDGNTETELCPYGTGACEVCDANCDLAPGELQFCGDLVVQLDEEECDNGLTHNSNTQPDACRTTCLLPRCGDDVIDTNESCDDGNTLNSDGCGASCEVEEGWDCAEGPCAPVCGDGMVLGNEDCDDGNAETEYCPYGATYCVVCDASCQFAPGLLQSCGDGVLQEGEGCDEGQQNNDYAPDACRTDCQAAGCGDGVIDGAEACDDNNAEDEDGCSAACLVEEGWGCVGQPSRCESICGDGLRVGLEECDDGNEFADPCPYGIMNCTVCGEDCQETEGSLQYCGDGVQQDDHEECDEGVEGLEDDNPNVFNNDHERDACRRGCFEAFCGDGVIDTAEYCDDRNAFGGDGCSSECRVESGWECRGEPSVCETIQLGVPGEYCHEALHLYALSGTTTATYGALDNVNLPPANACTGWASDGPEVFYAVTLAPGQQFKARVSTAVHLDPSIYLLNHCYSPARCLAGADTNYPLQGLPPYENLIYTWTGAYPQTFYFVVDAYCMGEFQCPTPYDSFTLSWSIE